LNIKDKCSIKPKIKGEEYSRSVGWLDSFNLTIGDTRYSSLLHPVFAAGWEVTSFISGQACEIFHKSTELQQNVGGASSSYHWYWVRGTKLYGVAGIIGVVYFDYWGTLLGFKDDAEYTLETLTELGIWEIYYMITNDESDDIDNGDIEYLLGTLVNNALGNPRCVDHCFWWVGTHGYHDFWGNGYLVSSNTFISDNIVMSYVLRDIIDEITTKGVYLFYWMANCHGDAFHDLWDNQNYHNNKALFWRSQGTYIIPDDSLHEVVRDHITYGQKSAQWMFGGQPGQEDHLYEDFKGSNDYLVDFVEYNYARKNYQCDGIFMEDTMIDYEFCFRPNTYEWNPSCRSQGVPCNEVSNPNKWSSEILPFRLHAWETSTGIYNCYVGFYLPVYLPSAASGGNSLHIEFDCRATSASSSVTNMKVSVYSFDWQQQIGSTWIVYSGGSTDSDWLLNQNNDFSSVSTGEIYNIFIFYEDDLYSNLYQNIYVKNIYIGNAIGNAALEDFEDLSCDEWELNPVTQANYPNFDIIYTGSNRGRLYMDDASGNYNIVYNWLSSDSKIKTSQSDYHRFFSFYTLRSNGYTYAYHDFYPIYQDSNNYLKIRFYYKYFYIKYCKNGNEVEILKEDVYSQTGWWCYDWQRVEIHLWNEYTPPFHYKIKIQAAREADGSSYQYAVKTLESSYSNNYLYMIGPTAIGFRGGWSSGNYGYAYWDNIQYSLSSLGLL